MKITSDLLLSVILVAIISSAVARIVAPYLYEIVKFEEGFASKNLGVLDKLLNHIDIVDIKLRDDNVWWNPKASKAIKIKGLRDGLLVSKGGEKDVGITVNNMVYNRGGLRMCSGDPCEDKSQWSFEFSDGNDLLYRLYPKGHMPTKEENERQRLIMTPGSWFGRIFRDRSNEINRPPSSWFSGSR